jgi:predicted nucleic acid-binding protein
VFTVVYDACVLYPAPLRDLLVRIAARGLVQAKWSDEILDECFVAIRRQRPELSETALARTRELMCKAVPDCVVTDYGDLVPGLQLPDPGDRHVLAVAIRSAAQTVVTWNLSDFPLDRLAPYGVRAQDPDTFILGLLNLHEAAVSALVVRQAADLKNPPRTVDDVLQTLHDNGLMRSVAEMRAQGIAR